MKILGLFTLSTFDIMDEGKSENIHRINFARESYILEFWLNAITSRSDEFICGHPLGLLSMANILSPYDHTSSEVFLYSKFDRIAK